jgi:hypothetical protein
MRLPDWSSGMDETVTVFRFKCSVAEKEYSPQHMWATLDAISRLHQCAPVLGSARQVEAGRLEWGIFFEDLPDRPLITGID